MERTPTETRANCRKAFGILTITIAMYMMMFAYAISNTIIGPLVMVFIKQYGISLADNGLISFCQGLGGILFLIVGILYGDKLLKSTWIIFTFCLYSISIIFLTFVSAYYQILFLFFFVGASTRMLDAMLNAHIADIYPEKRAFYLSILHACYGAGALIGPMLSVFFINQKILINLMFLCLGLFCIIVLSAYQFIKKRTEIPAMTSEIKNLRTIAKLIRNRNMLLMFALAFIYVGFALGVSTWFPTYMLQEMHTDIFFSGFAVSVLWIGVITGRISHSFLSLRFKKRNLIIFGNLIGGTAILCAVFLNIAILYVFGLFISAFFLSPVIPLSMAMAGELFPKNTGSASSIIILGGSLGLMIVPWITGLIAKYAGFWIAILLLGLFSYIASLLAIFIKSGKLDQKMEV